MTASTITRVMIVDDSSLIRQGIRAAIENEPAGRSITIVGEAGTAHAALSKAKHLRPDVILLNLRLPDDSGVNVCRQLRQILPTMCVLILTSSTDTQSIHESVVAGAHGYLLKDIDTGSLIQAIRDGHAGRPVITGQVATSILNIIREEHARSEDRSGVKLLSPQEQRVLAAIAAGHSNKEIAALMKLSENTVKNYIANMFQKLGIERRSQAIPHFLNSRSSKTK